MLNQLLRVLNELVDVCSAAACRANCLRVPHYGCSALNCKITLLVAYISLQGLVQ